MDSPRRELTPHQLKIRRRRSIVLAFILAGIVILFYITTIVRLGGNVADRVI
ncbi:MAG TPA: hypothetical protein VH933_17780 [Aestuariivirgaceae bacterium]|jgi:hypothetical protein